MAIGNKSEEPFMKKMSKKCKLKE